MSGHNLSGRIFGELTAVTRNGRDNNRNIYWFCICSCGQTSKVRATALVRHRAGIKSCGHLSAFKTRSA